MYDMRIRGIADAHRLARKRRCESSLPDGVVADAFPVCCGAIVVVRGCGDAGMRECGTTTAWGSNRSRSRLASPHLLIPSSPRVTWTIGQWFGAVPPGILLCAAHDARFA